MRKSYLFLFFFIAVFFFNISVTKAYDKFLDHTSWLTGYTVHGGVWNPVWWQTIGDSMINGKKYDVVENNISSLTPIPKQVYFREDTVAKKVYYLDSVGTEILWFDFGLMVGDSFNLSKTSIPYYAPVIAIDTIQSPWGSKRRIVFDTTSSFLTTAWIEGIGWQCINEDFGRFHTQSSIFIWTESVSCIYKNRTQDWVYSYVQGNIPCQSMCPSIGIHDKIEIQKDYVCYGDSLQLTGPCDSVKYWTDLSNPSVIIGTTDKIWVKPDSNSTYIWHGTLQTDTIYITVYHPLKIDLGPDTASCPYDSVTLVPYFNDTNVIYRWQDNSHKPYFVADTSGLIWVLVKDPKLCFINWDTILYTHLPLPYVQLPSSKTISVYDVPFELTWGSPIGGTYLGPGVNNGWYYPNISGTGVHLIKYFVIDSNACSDTAYMYLTVEDPYLSTENIENERLFRFYPNPNNGQFYIITDLSGQIQLIDKQGRLLYFEDIEARKPNFLSLYLDNGLYFLKFKSDDYYFNTRIQILK